MSDDSPGSFQSLYDQWQAATGSLNAADERVLSALIAYRRTANKAASDWLRTTVRERQHARDHMRSLTRQVWANMI